MLYLLSKLLPLALLPLGFSLILLLVGLIGRWRWPVITAVVLLWICSLGLAGEPNPLALVGSTLATNHLCCSSFR